MRKDTIHQLRFRISSSSFCF